MKKYYLCFGEGSKVNQIICAVLINTPVFAYGTCIGWMSPMALLLQSENSPRGTPLTDSEISWMASAGYLTCIVADFLMAYLSDKIGRKATLLFVSAITASAWILKLSSMETWAFVLARALIGITMAGSYVTCPIYTKEVSDASVRGVLGSLVVLGQTSGNLFLYIIGDVLSYRTILWICLSIPTLHLALFMMMPESPSYLVKKGNYQEAQRVVAWLRCRDEDDPKVIDELDEIKREQKKDDESSRFIIKNILTDKILFRAFRIAMLVSIAREVCGAIPVMNFAGEIFQRASTTLVLSPNQQAMMLGAVQVAGSALASSIVEKAGRKPLLLITSLVSGLSMCALASWYLSRRHDFLPPDWIPVATLCLCIFCDSSGLQPVSVVLIGEIFSFKNEGGGTRLLLMFQYRGTVMACAMASASFAAFLQALFFKPLVAAIGSYAVFYFFGAVCLLSTIYILICVPETKKKSLDEIYLKLKTKKERESDLEKFKAIEAGAA